ncbi:hypothetical protein OCA8868_00981 [Octadecabacter ascidiaceicola]|uniref:Uncharacterized protein n=1 Tax=Octadecabacter ascidiaceicola TaxID=1655543 RepID=A0A238JTR9_9RHOB|nr:hypothetical protein OCA8868_00981 [Octadecabacter ascidiaceicola]
MFVALGLCAATPALSQDDVWSVSPELAAATSLWLSGDDTAKAIWDIGTLAVEGELPARYLVRAIYYNFVPLDFPELDPEGRSALFPADPDAGRFFRPYPIDSESVPAQAARAV